MSLFEYVGFFIAILAAVVCGKWVYVHFGWMGLAGGALIGLIIGWIGGIAATALAFFIPAGLERLRHRQKLRRFFGRYWARDRVADWDELKKKLVVGAVVSGKVVARFYHGVIVDIGHGFPACLGRSNSKNGLNDPQPEVSEHVSAHIREFDDWERFIELTQVSEKEKSSFGD